MSKQSLQAVSRPSRAQVDLPLAHGTGHRLGISGEDRAADYLARLGYRIVVRRFRRRGGEIDLICVRERTSLQPHGMDRSSPEAGTAQLEEATPNVEEIVFVEVKTRTGIGFGSPESAVSSRKRKRIARTAEVFLAEMGLDGIPARFDVISIRSHRRVTRLTHIPNAFGLFELLDSDRWNEWRL